MSSSATITTSSSSSSSDQRVRVEVLVSNPDGEHVIKVDSVDLRRELSRSALDPRGVTGSKAWQKAVDVATFEEIQSKSTKNKGNLHATAAITYLAQAECLMNGSGMFDRHVFESPGVTRSFAKHEVERWHMYTSVSPKVTKVSTIHAKEGEDAVTVTTNVEITLRGGKTIWESGKKTMNLVTNKLTAVWKSHLINDEPGSGTSWDDVEALCLDDLYRDHKGDQEAARPSDWRPTEWLAFLVFGPYSATAPWNDPVISSAATSAEDADQVKIGRSQSRKEEKRSASGSVTVQALAQASASSKSAAAEVAKSLNDMNDTKKMSLFAKLAGSTPSDADASALEEMKAKLFADFRSSKPSSSASVVSSVQDAKSGGGDDDDMDDLNASGDVVDPQRATPSPGPPRSSTPEAGMRKKRRSKAEIMQAKAEELKMWTEGKGTKETTGKGKRKDQKGVMKVAQV